MRTRYGVALLLVGLVAGLALGTYVPLPAIYPSTTTSEYANQVAFTGTVMVQNAQTVRFYHSETNTTVNTVAAVDSNSKVNVILVGGISYDLSIKSSQGLSCSSSLYVPSGVSTFSANILCG